VKLFQDKQRSGACSNSQKDFNKNLFLPAGSCEGFVGLLYALSAKDMFFLSSTKLDRFLVNRGFVVYLAYNCPVKIMKNISPWIF
jgi:hypothetical protein